MANRCSLSLVYIISERLANSYSTLLLLQHVLLMKPTKQTLKPIFNSKCLQTLLIQMSFHSHIYILLHIYLMGGTKRILLYNPILKSYM